MKKEDNKRTLTLIGVLVMVAVFFTVFLFSNDENLKKQVVQDTTQMAQDLVTQNTYNMSDEDIKELPSTEIVEQTAEDEEIMSKEQAVEGEGFELQGNIAYEGDRAKSWNVTLGDYKGLTYYSQIDSRWSGKMYSSVGNQSQTIGTSGCGPTSASMIVTACKGAITPDTMADLFVQHGYRSANNGTYWSAFRAIADEFDIDYYETTNSANALHLLRNNHYVVASVGNGLFTSGGHFIVLTGLEGDTISIYDPYLYAGKFNTSTRRGKVTVSGNTVYCSVGNFLAYANAQGFFCYSHDGNVQVNSQPVTTSSYTAYVSTNSLPLNVRNAPNGAIIGSLARGTAVTVYENSGGWARIGNGRWVSSSYLSNVVQPTVQAVQKLNGYNSTGNYYRLKTTTYIYSKSNLTGTRYTYLPQTQVRVLLNISSNIDYVQVVKTGRKGYISKSAYTITGVKTTTGTYKRLKSNTTLYSKSNLTGTKYTYLPLTQVKILKHISNTVDYIYVVKTGRYAYCRSNVY